jgi:capsular exopolysaccharide synthesis family protein
LSVPERPGGIPRAGDDGDATTLRDYLAVLRRRWLVIAVSTVLVPAIALAVALRQSPLYRANADVLIGQSSVASNLTGSSAPAANVPADRYAQTQADLAREPAVADLAVRAVPGAHTSAGSLLDSSSVSIGQNSDILTFEVSNRNPDDAASLATAYARAFVRYRADHDRAALRTASRGTAAQLAQLRATGQKGSPLYKALLGQEQQLRMRAALQTNDASVVRTADSASKVQPRPKLYTGFGIAGGLLLGLVLAFLFEALDTRIRSDEELAAGLGLPLLGRIRTPRRKLHVSRRRATDQHITLPEGGKHVSSLWRSRGQLPVMISRPGGQEAEAFRKLRASIDLANIRHQARSFLITSALPREGKSTVAANLAVAFARAARRVTLVDLDLRDPDLGSIFGLNGAPGLADCAVGDASIGEAVVPFNLGGNGRGEKWGQGSLEIVLPGTLPPDPAAFIEAPVVAGLLQELSARSDVLLIDSPPLLSVGDGASLFDKVDAVVVVADRRTLRRPLVAELRRILDAAPAVRLGVIVAGADTDLGDAYIRYPAAARQRGRARANAR